MKKTNKKAFEIEIPKKISYTNVHFWIQRELKYEKYDFQKACQSQWKCILHPTYQMGCFVVMWVGVHNNWK